MEEENRHGRCITKNITFEDVGLVWMKKRKRNSSHTEEHHRPTSEFVVDQQELVELHQLGLPTTFGSTSQRTVHKQHSKSTAIDDVEMQTESIPPQSTITHNNRDDDDSNIPPAPVWHQAFDYETQHYYYYCEELQQTQWHPPENDFIPAALDLSEYTARQYNVASSPYNEAIESYKDKHGLTSLDETNNANSTIDSTTTIGITTTNTGTGTIIKARMESTGMMPRVLTPTGSHLHFISSSSTNSSTDNDDHEMHELQEELEHLDVTAADPPSSPLAEDARTMNGIAKNSEKQESRVTYSRLHKYWLQRYSLFSLFDSGITLDEEGWYSVTPEVIAKYHAHRITSAFKHRCTVIDAFGGVGGNAIQLALAGSHVITIEMDQQRAQIITSNAKVYGVDHLIDVVCADFLDVARRLRGDVVFLSPPWGGPLYATQDVFDVENMGGNTQLGLSQLLDISFNCMQAHGVVAWLPRNSSLDQIEKGLNHCGDAGVEGKVGRCEVENTVLNGVVKGMSVYYGALVMD